MLLIICKKIFWFLFGLQLFLSIFTLGVYSTSLIFILYEIYNKFGISIDFIINLLLIYNLVYGLIISVINENKQYSNCK
mgnify:CR=1 FL=1